MWNSVLVGILVAVIATIRQGGAGTISWLDVALGAWMIASPWVFAHTVNGDRTWNSIIARGLGQQPRGPSACGGDL